MCKNSWSRLFGCLFATAANRWRCAGRWRGWTLAILLWTVFVAKATAEPAPGPSPVSGSEQSLALRVMESDETCSEVRLILAEKVKALGDTIGNLLNYILFHSTLFYSIKFYSILAYSSIFWTVLFCTVLLRFVLLCSFY